MEGEIPPHQLVTIFVGVEIRDRQGEHPTTYISISHLLFRTSNSVKASGCFNSHYNDPLINCIDFISTNIPALVDDPSLVVFLTFDSGKMFSVFVDLL